jgi:NAD(P)-dependent dehydrogenase (short-subunit alcohol dehydrogenase family)
MGIDSAPLELAGKVAIVTGGGSGLGQFFAFGLAEAGAGVVIADLDRAAADETAAHVRSRGVPTTAVVGDIREPGAPEELIAAAEALGGPHILINNAGGWTAGDRQYPDAPAAAWGATLDLNLRVPMLLSQLALAPMGRLGGGAIVNVASSAALGSAAYGSPEYGATKAALIRFTTTLAELPESHGVRMTCIVPGWIGLPRAHEEVAALPPEQRAAAHLIPPAEIVTVVLELIRNGRSGTVIELPEDEPLGG